MVTLTGKGPMEAKYGPIGLKGFLITCGSSEHMEPKGIHTRILVILS